MVTPCCEGGGLRYESGVPDQKGVDGNVTGRKKARSKKVKLGNLLKYKAKLTRWSRPSSNIDENPIRTLGEYSKPSHEGYRNTIDLPIGNNMVPLRSDTIRMNSFQGLTIKVPHHGIDHWHQIQIFYDHVSFHLKSEINRAVGGKLRNKNAEESWEIIKNLALYDHEGWNDTKEFVKPFMAISTPQGISETPDRRLLELEDHINFLLKGSLLKELTTNTTPEKVLIREEAKFPVTKNVNSISLARGEEEMSDKTDETLDNTVKPTVTETEIPVKEAERNNETKNKPIKKAEKKEVEEVLSSRPVEYYLKHQIKKLIEGLVDNNRFNDSLSRARIGKVKGKTYNVLPRGPVCEAILKKKITKKEDVGGNFKIPCSIEGLKYADALVDQGSDVNVMPYSTYMKLTDEIPAETGIRLSLASHSYIYPL
nr:MAK10-like protein [Tanacetum cinerariifolium]